jgi:hypothetical protein
MVMKTTRLLLACLACLMGLTGGVLQLAQDQVPALVSWVAAAFDVRDCITTALTAWVLLRGGAAS